MTKRNKKKFGIDSEFYAYGYDNGQRSHVWYSVLPTRTQKISPLDRLKNMLVKKGFSLIHIYKSPYPAGQPIWIYKTTTGWQKNVSNQKPRTTFKLWMVSMSGRKELNVIRVLSSEDIDNASLEAYRLVTGNFGDYRLWKFGVLYGNLGKKSFRLMHYGIGFDGVVQRKDERGWRAM